MYNPYILERDKFVQASRAIDKELMLRLTAVGAVSYSAWVDFYASLSGMKFLNSRKIETTARKIDKLYEKAQDDWSHFAATKGLSFAYGDICTDHAYKLALNDLLIELFANYYYGTMKSWKMLGYLQLSIIVSGIGAYIFHGLIDFVEKTYGISVKSGYNCFNLGNISHSTNALSKMIWKLEKENCEDTNTIIDNNSDEIKKLFRIYVSNVSDIRWLMDNLHDASILYNDKKYGYAELE